MGTRVRIFHLKQARKWVCQTAQWMYVFDSSNCSYKWTRSIVNIYTLTPFLSYPSFIFMMSPSLTLNALLIMPLKMLQRVCLKQGMVFFLMKIRKMCWIGPKMLQNKLQREGGTDFWISLPCKIWILISTEKFSDEPVHVW